MEICYGLNQANFHAKHLSDLFEKFMKCGLILENKLSYHNFYFLKSSIDFLINYSMICFNSKPCLQSIELCLKVLEEIS